MVVSEYQDGNPVDKTTSKFKASNNTLLEPESFQTFWANVAKHFADDDHIIFDTSKCQSVISAAEINQSKSIRQRVPRHGQFPCRAT